jgi:hypothetical protein
MFELRTWIAGNRLHWQWTSGETVYKRATIEKVSLAFDDVLKKLCDQ